MQGVKINPTIKNFNSFRTEIGVRNERYHKSCSFVSSLTEFPGNNEVLPLYNSSFLRSVQVLSYSTGETHYRSRIYDHQ